MRVLIAQIDPVELDPAANLRRAEGILAQASAASVDLVVLPETWSTGYDLSRARDLRHESAAILDPLSMSARRHSVAVVGSMVLPEGANGAVNEAVVIGGDGRIVLRYAKSHLIDTYNEKAYFVPGRATPVFRLLDTVLGIAICYDLRFPELFRAFVDRGAEVLVLVSEWPVQRVEHLEILLRARAIENQAWVIACNRVGKDASAQYAGRSQVIDPMGRVVAKASPDAEDTLIVDLDLKVGRRLRREFPVLGDRWLAIDSEVAEIH